MAIATGLNSITCEENSVQFRTLRSAGARQGFLFLCVTPVKHISKSLPKIYTFHAPKWYTKSYNIGSNPNPDADFGLYSMANKLKVKDFTHRPCRPKSESGNPPISNLNPESEPV